MVGIVLVSHSKPLAESLRDLAMEMGQGKARVATAGGVDDPDNPVGTDAMRILEAIQEVYSDDGVLVFMDMGSAVMSAEMALEFLDESQKDKVKLCGASFVEGVVAATALAATGAGIDEIAREAKLALRSKEMQLGESNDGEEADEGKVHLYNETAGAADFKEEFTLRNTMGLHARPAAKIVQTVTGKYAEVYMRNITKESDFVSAKSMNSLISLNVKQNDSIQVAYSGPDARGIQEQIGEMMRANFGESTAPAPKRTKKATQPGSKISEIPDNGILRGIPISPGFAIAPVRQYSITLPEIPKAEHDDEAAELARLREAIELSEKEIEEVKRRSSVEIGDVEAAIFDAQVLLLKDPELLKKVEIRIQEGLSAPYAWKNSLDDVIEMYEQIIGDSLLSTRVIDLIDVGARVLEKLTGENFTDIDISEPCILCMNEISPSDAASLNADTVLGICCEKGSDVSHSAIIARSLGIPTVFNMGKVLSEIAEGTEVVLNAETGELYVKPDEAIKQQIGRERAHWLEVKEKAHAGRKDKGKSADDISVSVLANVGNEHEINQVLDLGAEGVGLFRTEFLFMERFEAPDEEEQFEAYKTAVRALGKKRPLVIRTLDVGGDKPVSYINIPDEENPFLGLRGIRYCLNEPEMFKEQLRAILRASAFGKLEIMFPMIATASELNEAMNLLQECRKELDERGQKYNESLKTGIMIEVPSAVESLDQLLPMVDFVSVGTNDLSQYMMAADRTNPKVAGLTSYYQPAVLSVIERTIRMANESGTEVSMCGEMARDVRVMPALLSFGLRMFSMSAAGIPEFKYRLRKTDISKLDELGKRVLECSSRDEVKKLLDVG